MEEQADFEWAQTPVAEMASGYGPELATIITIIFLGGLLGGSTAYIRELQQGIPANRRPLTLLAAILMGITAAAMVPFFLTLITSDIVPDAVSSRPQEKLEGTLVLFGICTLAALTSRSFIHAMTHKMQSDLERLKRQIETGKDEAEHDTQSVRTIREFFEAPPEDEDRNAVTHAIRTASVNAKSMIATYVRYYWDNEAPDDVLTEKILFLFETIKELSPATLSHQNWAVAAYLNKKKQEYSTAIQYYRAAIRVRGDNARFLYYEFNLGVCLLSLIDRQDDTPSSAKNHEIHQLLKCGKAYSWFTARVSEDPIRSWCTQHEINLLDAA